MLAARSIARPAVRAALNPSNTAAVGVVGSRAFSSTPVPEATLRDLEGRIKSVKNIEKVTKSMKMIATTRLAKAQKAMNEAKAYGSASRVVLSESGALTPETQPPASKLLYLVISSDRGLCGGVHSSVSKATRKEFSEGEGKDFAKEDARVVVVGDKPKAQLSRAMGDRIELSFNQVGKSIPTFEEALGIADLVEQSGIEYDRINIVYNKFISALSYEAQINQTFDAESLKKSPNFAAYELEDEALVKDLTSFGLANAIYAALVEGFAVEITARRNAMDNASKNAGEMITKLQQEFNTKRQGAITNDLVDIITGANAL